MNFSWIKNNLQSLNKHIYNVSLSNFKDLVLNEQNQTNSQEAILNLNNYFLIITGKVLSGDLDISTSGWVIQILSSTKESLQTGNWIIKFIANIYDEIPSLLNIDQICRIESPNTFRKECFPIIDKMSFERSTYIVLPQTKRLIRLHRLMPYFSVIINDNSEYKSWNEIVESSQSHNKKKRCRTSPEKKIKDFIRYMLDRSINSFMNLNDNYLDSLQNLEEILMDEITIMRQQYIGIKRHDFEYNQLEPQYISHSSSIDQINNTDIEHLFMDEETEQETLIYDNTPSSFIKWHGDNPEKWF